jgi:hypothetical protein
MRGIPQPLDIIVPASYQLIRGGGVGQQEGPSGNEDPPGLREKGFRGGKVMGRDAASNDVEVGIGKGKGLGISLLKFYVPQAPLLCQARGLP